MKRRAIATVSALEGSIADRELDVVRRKLQFNPEELCHDRVRQDCGPGNLIAVELQSRSVTEVFTGFGELGKSSESVARNVIKQINSYINADVPVGPYLADQLLIPLALAGGGEFKTGRLSRHTITNIDVIHQFIAGRFGRKEYLPGRFHVWFESSSMPKVDVL